MGAQGSKSVDLERLSADCRDECLEKCLSEGSYRSIENKEKKEVEQYIRSINLSYIQNPTAYIKMLNEYLPPLKEENDIPNRATMLKNMLKDENLVNLLKYFDSIFEKDDLFDLYSNFALSAVKSVEVKKELLKYFMFKKEQLPAIREEIRRRSSDFLSVLREACPKVRLECLGDVLRLKENYDRADAWKGL